MRAPASRANDPGDRLAVLVAATDLLSELGLGLRMGLGRAQEPFQRARGDANGEGGPPPRFRPCLRLRVHYSPSSGGRGALSTCRTSTTAAMSATSATIPAPTSAHTTQLTSSPSPPSPARPAGPRAAR